MRQLPTLLTLCAAMALPAAAQMDPVQTKLDPAAGQREARNTRARSAQLTPVTPEQALSSALQRCAPLPPFYQSDCEARVHGQGQASGSVIGGSLVRQSATTLPQSELEAQIQVIPPTVLPTAAPLKHGRLKPPNPPPPKS